MRGPYAKTTAVRRRILDAALAEFGDTGYYGTTMTQVAARAELSLTGLLHHFPTKDDLVIAALDHRSANYAELLRAEDDDRSGTPDPVQRLRRMVEVVLAEEQQPGLLELTCVLSGEATAPGHPAHLHYKEQVRDLRAFFTGIFRGCAERDLLTSETTPELLSVQFTSLITGAQQQWLYTRDFDVADALRAFLRVNVPAALG